MVRIMAELQIPVDLIEREVKKRKGGLI